MESAIVFKITIPALPPRGREPLSGEARDRRQRELDQLFGASEPTDKETDGGEPPDRIVGVFNFADWDFPP